MAKAGLITAHNLRRKHHACYGDYELHQLFPGPGRTLDDVLTNRDGPWADVSDTDRIWVATRPSVMNRPQLLKWLARLVERALAHVKNPEPRSLAVVAALLSDSITDKIREDAHEVVSPGSYAFASASHAADAAVRPILARWAADDAAFAALSKSGISGYDSERKQQKQDLLEIIEA